MGLRSSVDGIKEGMKNGLNNKSRSIKKRFDLTQRDYDTIYLSAILTLTIVSFSIITIFVTFRSGSLLERAVRFSSILAFSVAAFFSPMSFPLLPSYMGGLISIGPEKWSNEKARAEKTITNGFFIGFSYFYFSIVASFVAVLIPVELRLGTKTFGLLAGLLFLSAFHRRLRTPSVAGSYRRKVIRILEKDPYWALFLAGFGYLLPSFGNVFQIFLGFLLFSSAFGTLSPLLALVSHGFIVSALIMFSSLLMIYRPESLRLLSLRCENVRRNALWVLLFCSLFLLR